MNKIVSDRYKETYIEETLPSGLKAVIWQKKGFEKSFAMMATPLGAFDLLQKDEQGKEYAYHPGAAHFLEHKMFEDGEHDVMEDFSTMGANVNASTTYECTCYYFQTSSDLEKPLNLLLDFTQSLNITEKSVEKEKGIIIQELNMYQQMSDFRMVVETFTALYHNHPLKHDIGGTEQSVKDMTMDELLECYKMNYHPSTMICVVITGKDPNEVLDIISKNQAKKTFDQPKKIMRQSLIEPVNVFKQHVTFTMDIHKPKINLAFKLKGIGDSMERYRKEICLRYLLDAYFSSVNDDYQRWINEEIISDFYGYECDFGKDYGYLMFYTETNKKDEFIDLIQNNLSRMIHEGISDQVFDQLYRRYMGENIKDLNDFEAIAFGMMRTYFNHCDFFDVYDLIDSIEISEVNKTGLELDISQYTIVECQPNRSYNERQ